MPRVTARAHDEDARVDAACWMHVAHHGLRKVSVVVAEQHADSDLDRVEWLGVNPLVLIGDQYFDEAGGVPARDSESFRDGIEDPVVAHLAAM